MLKSKSQSKSQKTQCTWTNKERYSVMSNTSLYRASMSLQVIPGLFIYSLRLIVMVQHDRTMIQQNY